MVFDTMHHFDSQRVEFERQRGLSELVTTMESPTLKFFIPSFVDVYRRTIRENDWFFSDLRDRRISTLFSAWKHAHHTYFQHAARIYEVLQQDGVDGLMRPDLYAATIRSETLRGSVGRRSRTGPDAAIERLTWQVEEILSKAGLGASEIDEVLIEGGTFRGTPQLLSAEEELRSLFRIYIAGGHSELAPVDIQETDKESDGLASRLLRDYCKYSVSDFNRKLIDLRTSEDLALTRLVAHQPSRPHPSQQVSSPFRTVDGAQPTTLAKALQQLRAVNFLNLNLEVRYSFKGWAGVMHALVFSCLANEPWATANVYQNLNHLRRRH